MTTPVNIKRSNRTEFKVGNITLLSIADDSDRATVFPSGANAAELIALAQACVAAAHEITHGELNYEVVSGEDHRELKSLHEDIREGAGSLAVA